MSDGGVGRARFIFRKTVAQGAILHVRKGGEAMADASRKVSGVLGPLHGTSGVCCW